MSDAMELLRRCRDALWSYAPARGNDPLLKDIDAYLATGGWRPIETAPKDETYILLYCGDDFQAVGYWSTSIWVTKGGAWIYDECRSDTVELEPTHWQPLPPPPKGTV